MPFLVLAMVLVQMVDVLLVLPAEFSANVVTHKDNFNESVAIRDLCATEIGTSVHF